jgi:TPR repeat protein
MKSRLLFVALLFGFRISCNPQSITMNFGSANTGKCGHFAVGAANGDPSARTFEDIARVNQALAGKGNTDAAFELGLQYMEGLGVKQDLSLAEHWFEVGATSPGDKSLVGGMHLHGECFAKDLIIATRWYAAAGNRPADLFELAQGYRQDSPPQTTKAAAMYVDLLKQTGHPEVRRAQMELGNFVLDGKYTAGNDAKGRALNLEWARIITQELLGGEDYKIAMDYELPRNGVPVDMSMWLHFCRRAAAYNIDLAQRFLAEAITQGAVPNKSGYDDVAWTRLASDKQTAEADQLKAMESGMTPQQLQAADAEYQSLVQTRINDGAYYSPDDPLRSPSPAALDAMANDDPDVQLRRAFALEKDAQTNDASYHEAIEIYRTVRDCREIDVRFILGRNHLNATNGLPVNKTLARIWLTEAANRGSKPAQALLSTFAAPPAN